MAPTSVGGKTGLAVGFADAIAAPEEALVDPQTLTLRGRPLARMFVEARQGPLPHVYVVWSDDGKLRRSAVMKKQAPILADPEVRRLVEGYIVRQAISCGAQGPRVGHLLHLRQENGRPVEYRLPYNIDEERFPSGTSRLDAYRAWLAAEGLDEVTLGAFDASLRELDSARFEVHDGWAERYAALLELPAIP